MSRTKPPSDKVLTIRIPAADLERLEQYCKAKEKTKTEVVLGLIRRLRV